ncbi:uncharacterized protein A1O9_11519 [Exophiala aquamarina CBS 119918]|uniref:Rhodopsin domain-containing protein n=1 Tax=Exophiala aquamarina CBS 119918 TaxID=1182545 RepID=A0A072NWS0_9EURO|nr:uncharacterized protein A1O9_11519 [Exophiala aquamarina CBS 119918]KEF52279.1 hypothetical protein A1O9_11519 [Exophiala aquamarina CBS 119918]
MTYLHTLYPRIYHGDPPALQSKVDVNPTLIVSWWCTIFALTAIGIRLFGRWIRTEKLFLEDKIMFYSTIPLLIRMGLVHVILIWGTNNTVIQGLTPTEIRHREIGSKLVLAARIFYAAYIWVAKFTVLEFLKRLIGASWAKSYEVGLRLIYAFLIITYIGVVIGTLTECQPFTHYWQVVPDPGPSCREGLVQLIVMGVCDMMTDVVLIVYPIPLVWQSSMRFRKKVSLIVLFLLSLILIAITAYRIPSTISRRSSQQFRSLLASLEILAAAGVSNAIVIGSFIRDKGVKKAKFRASSFNDDTSSLGRQPTRTRTRSITHHHWGSDEDLARSVGVSLPPTLQHGAAVDHLPRLAEVAVPNHNSVDLEAGDAHNPSFKSKWNFAEASRNRRKGSMDSISSSSTDIKLRELNTQFPEPTSPGYAEPDTPSKMGFFDVGGLVEKGLDSPSIRSRQTSTHESTRRLSQTQNHPGTRSGSKAFLSDIGGLLSRHVREEDEITSAPRKRSSPSRSPMRLGDHRKDSKKGRLPSHQEDEEPIVRPQGPDDLTFTDIGGLLR